MKRQQQSIINHLLAKILQIVRPCYIRQRKSDKQIVKIIASQMKFKVYPTQNKTYLIVQKDRYGRCLISHSTMGGQILNIIDLTTKKIENQVLMISDCQIIVQFSLSYIECWNFVENRLLSRFSLFGENRQIKDIFAFSQSRIACLIINNLADKIPRFQIQYYKYRIKKESKQKLSYKLDRQALCQPFEICQLDNQSKIIFIHYRWQGKLHGYVLSTNGYLNVSIKYPIKSNVKSDLRLQNIIEIKPGSIFISLFKFNIHLNKQQAGHHTRIVGIWDYQQKNIMTKEQKLQDQIYITCLSQYPFSYNYNFDLKRINHSAIKILNPHTLQTLRLIQLTPPQNGQYIFKGLYYPKYDPKIFVSNWILKNSFNKNTLKQTYKIKVHKIVPFYIQDPTYFDFLIEQSFGKLDDDLIRSITYMLWPYKIEQI